MNEFFVTVTDSLGINDNFSDENATGGITDPITYAYAYAKDGGRRQRTFYQDALRSNCDSLTIL